MSNMGTVLNSWKEIASYVGRGVRTVQRWERELQFPVRRPRGRSRSAVIAIPADIDQWLARSATRAGEPAEGRLAIRTHAADLARSTQELRERTKLVQSEVLRAMEIARRQLNRNGAKPDQKARASGKVG